MFVIVSEGWGGIVAHSLRKIVVGVPITQCGRKRPKGVLRDQAPRGSYICGACWATEQAGRA